MREPFRIRRAFLYHSKQRLGPVRTRIALALERPIPEELRERYFLDLHMKAERAYEPKPYPGKMLTFYGQDLYEDPSLGWSDTVSDLETHGVPGQHDNNRQVVNEPYVEFVRDRLLEALQWD